MDQDGPITKRCRAIKQRVEDVGRKMGVPEEAALRYVEIDTQQRLNENFEAWRAEQGKFNLMKLIRTIASTLVGEIDAHNPRK